MIKNKGLRRAVSLAVPIMILALALLSALFFDSRRHMIVSLTAAAMTVVLFISGFEKKSTGTRRLVIVSVMTALCFLGRCIPKLKPIMALTIITGIYLGGESGFLVGAMTAILTNFYFGQGPWTVFQMFAWGIAGYCAGMFSTMLKKSRPLLIIYGALAGVVYSFIMDIWTVLWYNGNFELKLYLAALVTAISYTISYAVSSVLFLLIFAKPFGSKLERIKVKYGV